MQQIDGSRSSIVMWVVKHPPVLALADGDSKSTAPVRGSTEAWPES